MERKGLRIRCCVRNWGQRFEKESGRDGALALLLAQSSTLAPVTEQSEFLAFRGSGGKWDDDSCSDVQVYTKLEYPYSSGTELWLAFDSGNGRLEVVSFRWCRDPYPYPPQL